MKRSIGVFAVVCLILTAFPMCAFAATVTTANELAVILNGTGSTASDNGTVTLENKITLSDDIRLVLSEKVTLDLQGKKITCETDISAFVIDTTDDCTFTVIDTAGGGSITGGNGADGFDREDSTEDDKYGKPGCQAICCDSGTVIIGGEGNGFSLSGGTGGNGADGAPAGGGGVGVSCKTGGTMKIMGVKDSSKAPLTIYGGDGNNTSGGATTCGAGISHEGGNVEIGIAGTNGTEFNKNIIISGNVVSGGIAIACPEQENDAGGSVTIYGGTITSFGDDKPCIKIDSGRTSCICINGGTITSMERRIA